MKKFLFVGVMLLTAFCFGQERKYSIESEIGPVTAITTTTARVTISSSTTGKYNCLEYVVARSTNAYTLSILNGGTTFYQVTKAASEEHQSPQNTYICGSSNTTMGINLIPTSGSNVELNYKGFVGR